MIKFFFNVKVTHIPIIPLIMFVFTYAPLADEVYSKNQKANNLYKQGKYDEALKLYDDALLISPSDAKIKMNKGSVLYQTGQFDEAEELYNSALSIDEKSSKADAHYNMGNILFRQGEQLQKTGNPSSKEKYQAALQHFIQTLDQRPTDTDAKWNLQLAHNRIKQVEQQQKQQQNKNDKNDKSKDDKNNQQNQDQNKNDQNKKDDQKQKDDQDKKPQDQDKKDQDKQQQKEPQNQSQQQPTPQDMKKEEAKRLIELYADDADSLNKPPKKANASRQAKPEQDW